MKTRLTLATLLMLAAGAAPALADRGGPDRHRYDRPAVCNDSRDGRTSIRFGDPRRDRDWRRDDRRSHHAPVRRTTRDRDGVSVRVVLGSAPSRVVVRECYEPVIERRVVVRPAPVSAWEFLESGHHRDAQSWFGRRAADAPYDAGAKVGYAVASAALHDTARAAWAFRRALRVDDRALTDFRAGSRLDRELRVIERSAEHRVQSNPYDVDAVFVLAAVRTLRGDDASDLPMLSAEDRELLMAHRGPYGPSRERDGR